MEKDEKYSIIYLDAEHKLSVWIGEQKGGNGYTKEQLSVAIQRGKYGYTKKQLSVAIGELMGKGVEQSSIFPVKFIKDFKLQVLLDE